MEGEEAPAPMLAALRPHARRLFVGGLTTGILTFALYVAWGQIAGGESVSESPVEDWLALAVALCGLAAIVGALAMPPATHDLPAGPDESPTESFLRLAHRAERWIERARLYIILGGIFGGLVMVPLILLGLFFGPKGDASLPIRIFAMGAALAFAAVVVLWWRRVVEIDRELRDWRLRVARLHVIEKELLAEP